MSTLLDKITTYFNRDPELQVLFVFHDIWVANDLDQVDWPEGYRWVRFKGDWFTTKYHLDHEWANDKVVIYFDQVSPLEKKSLQSEFPLMDVLVANMEFHSQDTEAFMQQYDIPRQMARFVEKNIQQLQTSKMMKLLEPYYRDHTITEDMTVRAFLSHFLGKQRILDWDSILLQVLFLSCEDGGQKRRDFYTKLRKNQIVQEKLQRKWKDIFGVGYDDNTEEKVKEIVLVLKYNAITQNLAPVKVDRYSPYRIKDALALEEMNRLLELAAGQKDTALALDELLDYLGGDVRDEEIIRWYGPEADYYYVPDGLCVPIVKTLLDKKLETEPEVVLQRLQELMMRRGDNGPMKLVMDTAVQMARYYEKVLSIGSITLNTPDDYVAAYQQDYYLLDQLYRQSLETYFKVDPSVKLFDTLQAAKKRLDRHYAKWTNLLNLEWTKCLREAGGMKSVHLMRQENFYKEKVEPANKKIAVIVSDALRYEVAQDLMQELAKWKHFAHLDVALAMLPTETKFCKPALLPHRKLQLCKGQDEVNMMVDDKILNTIDKRSEYLQNYREDAIAVSFEEVAKYNREVNRDLFKHRLVYIFHDQIDQEGHGGTPAQVVEACRRTIIDISKMVNYLHDNPCNVNVVMITADHGFLFNDISFAEKDKQKVVDDCIESKTRYYLTRSSEEVKDVMKFKLNEVSAMDTDKVDVAVPEGTNRFAAPSGGYQFAHGGASLQELLVPVIDSVYERKDTKQPVGVMLLGHHLSVQSSRLRFNLLQTDAVSMEKRERTITCALYSNGQPVTLIKEIVLNMTDTMLDNRKILVDLTLNKKVKSKIFQLKVYDVDDKINPLISENVTNNTLIENDFDF
jgi:hypothetical protein